MHVLVSGAGVAGPALAWFLAKAGAHTTLVEKAPRLLPYGQNIDIDGSAAKVVGRMGLLDEVRRLNTREKGTQFIDPKGRPFAPFPVKEGINHSLTSELEILRGDLSAVFYEATKDHPSIKYLFGTTINKVISNDERAVKVELSNGEVREFDLLVAADGQWSKVRKQCFPSESVTIVDKGMYAVYGTIPRLSSDNDFWNIYQALGSRIVSTRPDPHGTTRTCLTFMPRNAAQKKAWQEASRGSREAQNRLLRQEFGDAGWQAERILDAMEKAPDFYFQAIQQIRMSTWSSSRVICLGDAAYAPTPLTGAGASLAILGAYVLAGELSKLRPGEHPSRALAAYESAFRPHVEETQQIPAIFPGVAHPETAFKRWLFQICMSALSKIVANPWISNRFARKIDDEDFKLPQYPFFDDDGSNDAPVHLLDEKSQLRSTMYESAKSLFARGTTNNAQVACSQCLNVMGRCAI